MRRGLILLVLLGCGGGGQGTIVRSEPTYPEQAVAPSEGVVVGRSDTIPPGTTVWLELAQPLSAERNRIGDRFYARAAQEIRSEYGQVLIPRGAVVDGTIVDLQPAYGDAPAAIGLRLEGIEMAGYRQPLHASIVRTEVQGVQRGRVRAGDVLIGAAAGAILGGLIEGAEGALVGGGLGAGAGALISLGRGSQRIEELPAGTGLAVRLDEPVRSLASLRGIYY